MNKNTINILLLENNSDDARSIEEVLKKDSSQVYHLTHLNSLSKGLQFIEGNAVDIILLDLDLPDGQGLQTILKVNERYPHLPIIVFTDNDDPKMASDAVRMGAQDFLIKGRFGSDLVIRAIHYAIERKQSRIELDNERAELSALIYNIGDAIIATDTNCVITRMNPVAEALTGYSRSQSIGQPLNTVYHIIGQDSHDDVQCPVKQFIETGQVSTQVEQLVLVSKDGHKVSVSNTVSLVTDSQGKTTGAVLVFHDDTDQRISQRLLQIRFSLLEFAPSHTLNELLEEALDQIGELADSPIGFYHFVNSDQQSLTLQEWSTRTKKEFCKAEGRGSHYGIDQAGVWADSVRLRKPVIHNDYASLPNRQGLPEGHAPVVRELVVPVIRENTVVAVLGVGNKQNDYDQKDVEALAYLADVTWHIIEQKQSEEKLRDSEQQFRQIIETAEEGIWIADVDGHVSFINQRMALMLGYTKEEILGSEILNYIFEEDLSILKEKLQNRKEGIKETYEWRYRRKDGNPVWVLINAAPMFDENGQYNASLIMVSDNSKRKQAEHQTKLERDRALSYFSIAGTILLVLDKAGTILQINQKGLDVLGYDTEGELLGRNWFETCIHKDARNQIKKIHQHNVDPSLPNVNYNENAVLTKTGEERIIAWHTSTLMERGEDQLDGVLISGEDITERLQARMEIEMLVTLSRNAGSESNLEDLLFLIANQIVDVIPSADAATIFLLDEQAQEIHSKAWAGYDDENIKNIKFSLKKGQIEKIFRTRKSDIVDDTSKDADFISVDNPQIINIKSHCAVPIIFNEQVIGIIFTDNLTKTNAFTQKDTDLIETIAHQLAGEIQNAQLTDQVRDQHELLQASESQYRSLFNTMFNGFALHEIICNDQGKPIDYRFLDVNPAFENMTGLKEKDIINRTALEILPEIESVWIEKYGQVALTGIPAYFEDYAVEFDKYFEVAAFSPQKGQFAVVLSDVTQRRKFTDALLFERDKAQKYLDIAGVMITALDIDGVITLINQKGAQVLGYEVDELIGKNWFTNCVPSTDEKRARQLYKGFIGGAGKPGEHFEQIVVTKEGQERLCDWVSIRLLDTNGNIIGTLSSGEDVTDRKKAESALKDNEERLRNIFENSTNMFYAHSLDKIFTFVSPQSEQILGYTPDELLGQPTSKIIEPSLNDEKFINTNQAIRTGLRQPPFELRFCTKQGKNIWIEVREVPIIENGKTVSIVGSLNDITDRKAADEEIKNNLASLQAANMDQQSAYERIQRTMESTIRTIAKTVEVRDPYTAGHHQRVSELAVAIAEEMGLDEEVIKALELAGVIHDLGKIQIPAEILSKPGELTEIEFNMIKTHPAVGYKLLKDIEFPWPLADIIYQHHEKMDGSGYPRGLKGEEISLEGRIIAVADTVEAMSSHRPYRAALGIDAALNQIKLDRTTLYDAEVVDACLALFKGGYKLSVSD